MPDVDAAEPAEPAGSLGVSSHRLRVRYSKAGKVRYTGHRDVVRMWERALRRSGLPLAWSEGFSPRPVVSFGLALPTGAESLAEYLDLSLRATPGPPAGLAPMLSALLPVGVDVQTVAALPPGSRSLQQEVSSCSWRLEVLGLGPEELATRVERVLAAPSVLVERHRKGRAVRDDLRPAVLDLVVAPPSGTPGTAGAAPPGRGVWLHAELATRPRGVRPRELLQGLGTGLVLAGACRSHQWIERDGARWEPLAVTAGSTGPAAAHAAERAS